MTKAIENSASKRQQRLLHSHRRHVGRVAEIFLACGETHAKTAEEVRKLIPSLRRFNRSTLTRWADTPEWKEALEAARENAAIKRDLEQRRRSKIMFRWASKMLKHFIKEQQRAVREERASDVRRLEDRIREFNRLVIEEEKLLNEDKKQEEEKHDEPTVTLIFEGPEDGTVPPDES